MPDQPPTEAGAPRREGFAGQRIAVVPDSVVQSAIRLPLLRGLIPVATGFFPAAERHLVERTQPLPDAIVIVCVSGRGWIRLAGAERCAVGPSTALFIPPGEPHAYGADAAEPWSIHWAHFQGESVVDYFHLLGVGREQPALKLLPDVAGQLGFEQLYERLNEDYTVGNLLAAATRLRLIFSDMNRLRTRPGSQVRADAIERTIAWMREHIRCSADLSKLAKEAGMSASHYSALFRRNMGYSPVDYFLRMKIQRACGLLDMTPMRIEEIAASVGYDDAFYFSRLFRRVMGKSPRVYRLAEKG